MFWISYMITLAFCCVVTIAVRLIRMIAEIVFG